MALPSLTASLLRWAQVRLRETANTGNRCVFFVGPDALIGPFLGRPVCRSYGFTEALSETWRAGLGFAPSSAPVCALGHLPPQGEGLRAGEDTRPYGIYRNCPFFCRGRSQTGPREGHTPGWLLSAFGRFTFSPSPTNLKKAFQTWVGEPLGAPARIRTGSICSTKPGAVVEPHRRQFLNSQPPVGRREFR